MKTSDYLKNAHDATGIKFIGLLRKTARIKHGYGSEISDILGWDIILRAEDGHCYEFYAAQQPLKGMTQPQPIMCPLGIVAFDEYKFDIVEAIKIFQSQNGGDKFTNITLCWPITCPAVPEPYWYFRTNLGVEVVIGAYTGQMKLIRNITVLYMAQSE
jgi:hypothetical protein